MKECPGGPLPERRTSSQLGVEAPADAPATDLSQLGVEAPAEAPHPCSEYAYATVRL